MKKDRNSFFQEANFVSGSNFPNPNFNVANAPYQTTSYANQGFYAGPPLNNAPANYPNNYPTNNNYNYNNDYSDFESRLSKLERQINRLDTRLTKLENSSLYSTDDFDNTTNVYMV